MNTADYRVWLAILPDQREQARIDAGKHPDGRNAIEWSAEDQLWFARPGADLSRLQKWLPDKTIRSSGGGDPQAEFRDELISAGLVLDGMPVMDGKRHRVAVVEGKKGNRDGVYRGFLDGIKPGGWYINYHRADNDKDITRWKASGVAGEGDPLARVHIRAIMRQSQDNFAREQAALYASQTAKAKALYERLPAADTQHGYLKRKGVTVSPDIRQTRNGALVVPFYDVSGEFRTLQYIPPDGEKYLFKDAPKSGHFRVEGAGLRNGAPILYAEGYATARSLHMLTGHSVVMTIDAGNMQAVAHVLKANYPDSPHMFMADVDHAKEKNKGVLSAERAASATGGTVLLPDLTAAEIALGFTDFNDIHQFRGAEQLRDTLMPAIAQALEQLNYKDAQMATSDNAQPDPDSIKITPTHAAADSTSPRRPGAAKEKTDEILSLREQGLKPSQIAEQLGIGQTSVYRILRANPVEEVTAVEQPTIQSSTEEASENSATLTATSESVPVATSDIDLQSDSAANMQAITSEKAETPSDHVADNIEQATDDKVDATAVDNDFTNEFASLRNRLERLKNDAASLESTIFAQRLGELINERIKLTEMWSQGNDTSISEWPSAECEQLEAELKAILEEPPVSATSPLISAPGEENAILVGPPRMAPAAEDTPGSQNNSRIDADQLLSRITHEKQPDGKSVLYSLDGAPAFFDKGNRLVMAEGSSSHEEKVLAALLTAANHYHGRIELTGSDSFKAFAIQVIVANKLDVSMKNAGQQADLDAARLAAGQPVIPADAVRGDPVSPRTDTAPPVQPTNTPPVPPAAPTNSENRVTTSHETAPVVPPKHSEPKINSSIHTPAEKARSPVTGKVTACGQAPFRFDPKATESTYITLRTKEGTHTFWGKELAGLLRETNLKPGRMVTLQWMGEQPVTVKVPQKNEEGIVTHYKNVDTHRNQWSLSPVGGSRVQTGTDEMVTLSAFDVNRYTQVQKAVVSRLELDMPAPPKTDDGLYWIKPDGQGSTRPGDALSASRPARNEHAGAAVMSSWGKDGLPDLYLVQGDGNYLQGVVRQKGIYQHVLVSLPDSKEAPPMVINMLTQEGAIPVGSGNGINRSNGQPVPREHVVIRLSGDEQQRIAKLDTPAQMEPAMHARLGYDERYKAETSWVKDQPAAAPQAAPVTPPRPAQ